MSRTAVQILRAEADELIERQVSLEGEIKNRSQGLQHLQDQLVEINDTLADIERTLIALVS